MRTEISDVVRIVVIFLVFYVLLMRTYQDNLIKVISGQADLITSTLWSVLIAMYYFSYFIGICICAEQTFTEASAKNKKFPEAFSIAMFAYTSTLLSVKMSTRRWEYQ